MRFSQRIGKRPIKTILQVESIDIDLKNRLWNNILEDFFDKLSTASSYGQERFIALANGPDENNSNYNYSDTTPATPINPIQPTTITNTNPSLPSILV